MKNTVLTIGLLLITVLSYSNNDIDDNKIVITDSSIIMSIEIETVEIIYSQCSRDYSMLEE